MEKTEKDTMASAVLMYDDANYLLALPLFENLYNAHPKEEFLKYCYGKCALYRSDKHEMALKLLGEVYEKNKKVDNIEYDFARANHFNYKFDEALVLLDKYLSKKGLSPEFKNNANQLKQYCINGKELYANPKSAKITNFGNVINTKNEEYVPVISADESIMIYTYRGPECIGGLQNEFKEADKYGTYFEDIFQAVQIDGQWTKPSPIKNVNTNSHDGAIALSADGFYLFVYRDSGDDHGDIYISNSLSGEWSIPQKLKGEVNSYSWEGSCSMTANGKYLYFSSERGGGFGGKDIYRATLLPDSTWGNVVNLGDSINTALDDDAPFIHPDGVTLFYSSKGKNSMGGYDIFQSRLNWKDSTFSKPINLGYPINTTDDDIYYVLSANGDRGYYASGKSGGEGLKDIYTVYPGYVGKKPSIYIVKGKIMAEGMPIAASVLVEIVDQNNKKLGEFGSSSATGNYLVSLPSGGMFKLTYKYKSYPYKTLDINTTSLEGYDEKLFDINFNFADTLKPVSVAAPIIKDTVVAVVTPVKPVKEPVVKKDDFVPNNQLQQKIKDYSEKYGDITAEGLLFKVQIAAYKIPKNYTYAHLKGLGAVENLLLDDGITRITIGGEFKTLKEAYEHNKKVVLKGQKDAFVTVLYNGKRIYLEDLEKMGVFVGSNIDFFKNKALVIF
ncbi:MAG: PD40 domain-containing protein [Bacteroidetes bacterium]|nr:PD40 domain-containing protein [Bacteroidota bacterium]